MQITEIKNVFLTKSDLIAFTFGLSCCIFTLIGLVGIYISINNQHVIQKCREIIWELLSMIQGEADYGSAREKIRKSYWLYNEILGKKFLGNFSNIVIYSTIFILIGAGYIWINLVNYLNKSVSINTEFTKIHLYAEIGIIILIVFGILLALLSNVKFVGRLDNPKNILNGNKITKASTIALAGLSIELILNVDGYDGNIDTMARLNYPLPFRNFSIMCVVFAWNHSKDKMETICKFDTLKIGEYPLKFHSNYEGAKALWLKHGYGVDIRFSDINDNKRQSENKYSNEINLQNFPIINPNFYLVSNEGCIYLEFEEINLKHLVNNENLHSEKVYKPTLVKESYEYVIQDGEVARRDSIN